jgi:uncharacterized protein (TIGR00255 family)
MLLSMTGFGRAEQEFDEKTIIVEVRSLNSKFTDMRFRLPQNYRHKEPELRKLLGKRVERGKLEVSLEVKSGYADEGYALNTALFKKYYKELVGVSEELKMEKGDMMQAILRMPNVVAVDDDELNEAEWEAVLETLEKAMGYFEAFRKAEGKAMEKDARSRIDRIFNLLNELSPMEDSRLDRFRTRLWQNVEEFVGKENVDANRFEQELLYYLEKMDFTEEKVRLEQHCKYFLEELDKGQSVKGRKLGFISQEMGREINTLGAKANSSDIQRVVVSMKDELEKIKELLANTV